jgi:glutamine synthetase
VSDLQGERDIPATGASPARLLEQHGIHTVEVAFADLWGYLCGKRLPAEHFLGIDGELSFPIAPLTWSVTGDIADSPLASADNGFPNVRFRADLSTLRPVPWREGVAICLLDAHNGDGTPFPLHGRHAVRSAAARLEALGYSAFVAPELEFYLCTPEWEPLFDGHRPFSLTKGSEAEAILTEIRRALGALGMDVVGSQTEYGPAQFEINVGPSDPLRAADNALLLKHVVKDVARRHGARATFMPAPFLGASTSGFHLHQSLLDLDGAPAWAQAEPPSFGPYLAGLVERLPELTAMLSPSINAYKRMIDGSFASNRVSWGQDNRSVAVRTLDPGGPASRLELRTPSSDANPYFVVAASLHAGADGLERSLALPPPISDNAYAHQDLPLLPRSLAAAVELLDASEFARAAMSPELIETLVGVQRLELGRFAAHTTDWERDRYLECS